MMLMGITKPDGTLGEEVEVNEAEEFMLFGVGGLFLHYFHGQFVLTHAETGSQAGCGLTAGGALEDAIDDIVRGTPDGGSHHATVLASIAKAKALIAAKREST